MTDADKVKTFRYKFKAGTGKILKLSFQAVTQEHANFLCRKELAQRFQGKTYKKLEGPVEVRLRDHI